MHCLAISLIDNSSAIELNIQEEDEEKSCYKGTMPNAEDIPEEIKSECGDLPVIYVRAMECAKGMVLQK